MGLSNITLSAAQPCGPAAPDTVIQHMPLTAPIQGIVLDSAMDNIEKVSGLQRSAGQDFWDT